MVNFNNISNSELVELYENVMDYYELKPDKEKSTEFLKKYLDEKDINYHYILREFCPKISYEMQDRFIKIFKTELSEKVNGESQKLTEIEVVYSMKFKKRVKVALYFKVEPTILYPGSNEFNKIMYKYGDELIEDVEIPENDELRYKDDSFTVEYIEVL